KPGANCSMNRVFISKYPIVGDLDATFIGPGGFKKDAPALQQVVLSFSQPRKARRNQCAHLLRHQKFLTALARLSYNSNPDLAVYELHFLVISHPIILRLLASFEGGVEFPRRGIHSILEWGVGFPLPWGEVTSAGEKRIHELASITALESLPTLLKILFCRFRIIQAYRVYQQLSHLHGLVFESDIKCLSQLRMDRQAFFKLCKLLCEKGSLVRSKRVSPEEMVAMFLSILAHHVKNRVVGFNFKRSRRTVSKCFHECLRAMIRCQKEFWKKPEPITNNSTDPKWKWFTVSIIFCFICVFSNTLCTLTH
ncbi:hypothetical protein CICLE_v10023542mg, partial [Citrus x clementina]